eukprot:768514-Pleurochrysis_carterae.AAC.2
MISAHGRSRTALASPMRDSPPACARWARACVVARNMSRQRSVRRTHLTVASSPRSARACVDLSSAFRAHEKTRRAVFVAHQLGSSTTTS